MFLFVLYSELDAKAEGQCADSIEEIVCALWCCMVLPRRECFAQSNAFSAVPDPLFGQENKTKIFLVIGRQCLTILFFVFFTILSDAAVLSACMLKTGTVLGCSVGSSAGKAIEDT